MLYNYVLWYIRTKNRPIGSFRLFSIGLIFSHRKRAILSRYFFRFATMISETILREIFLKKCNFAQYQY